MVTGVVLPPLRYVPQLVRHFIPCALLKNKPPSQRWSLFSPGIVRVFHDYPRAEGSRSTASARRFESIPLYFLKAHSYPSSGQAMVTGIVPPPSSPRPSFSSRTIVQRVQHSRCSSNLMNFANSRSRAAFGSSFYGHAT